MSQTQSIEEAIAITRNEIVLMHSKCEEVSTRGFDRLVSFLQQQSQQMVKLNDEVKRLEELCQKNNINHTIPSVPKIQTVNTTKEKTKPISK